MPGCGTDTERFRFFAAQQREGPAVILVPARIIVEKGIFEAVAASAMLTESGIEHEMWFSSDIDPGNPLSLTRQDLDRLQREQPSIRFLGFQDDIAVVYEQVDIVCLPSYREGLPTALVEASACGRAIVATDVQGCREIVVDEVTGLLVPPRDAEALAVALQRLICDAGLRDRLRRQANRAFLERFTREASLAAVLPTYESLAQSQV
jgi:glycosyltransferase involved in cell wall biosynthesis